MATAKQSVSRQPSDGRGQRAAHWRRMALAISLGALATMLILAYTLADRSQLLSRLFPVSRGHAEKGDVSAQTVTPAKADVRLTREMLTQLLAQLDQARRQKDAAAILRHLAPDAIITVHMKQGTQQQTASLTREEYGATLQMAFAFPSGNDYTRVSTTITLAPDERSAKVSFKSTETLHQQRRELKIDGEGTLIVRMRDDRPVIVALEEVVPGDST